MTVAAGRGTRDQADLRRVFATHPTGVAALAATTPDATIGMAASSFVPVSLDPPLVSVCVAHTSTTWPLLRDLPAIGISILSAEQGHVSRQLAAKGVDRFAGLGWRTSPRGAVLIHGASAWFECSVQQQVRAGDHDIVVFGIDDLDADVEVSPLVFHGSGYRRLAS